MSADLGRKKGEKIKKKSQTVVTASEQQVSLFQSPVALCHTWKHVTIWSEIGCQALLSPDGHGEVGLHFARWSVKPQTRGAKTYTRLRAFRAFRC